MNQENFDKQIVDNEKKYWKCMSESDIEKAVSLTQFPCVIVGPKGVRRVKEAEYRKLWSNMDNKQFKGVELKNPKVEQLNDKTALITYETCVNNMDMLDVSTWVKDDDHWRCAFHSETPIHGA